MTPVPDSRSRSARRTAWGLATLLGSAGVLHLVRPANFDRLIPGWLPGSARRWTVGSGVAELGVAALLAVPRTRRLGGAAATALFVGVFPGNLKMTYDWRSRGAGPFALSLARLPLQGLLIRWSERVRRHG